MSKYPNSGVLFKNDKQGNESRPDYQGSAEVAGEEYWLSAWIKQGDRGKFLSLSFKPKQERSTKSAVRPVDEDFDSMLF